MKPRILKINFTEFHSMDDLPGEKAGLVQKAIEAASDAYVPYSAYHVGAAVLLENGELVTGSNQENAAYPSGMCAERVALFYSGSRFPGVPVKCIAVAAVMDGRVQEEPVAPCGACRQVLCEMEARGDRPMEVILYGTRSTLLFARAEDLLPLPFQLKKG